MTKEQRERVVELLRCAADSRPDCGLNGMFGVSDGYRKPIPNLAWDVLLNVAASDDSDFVASVFPVDEKYRAQLLEAAARVEEGSWP